MILMTWGEEPADNSNEYCDKFRRALEISLRLTKKDPWFGFDVVPQYHHRKGNKGWCSNHTGGFGIHITRHWALGQEHIYYDGEHCSFSIGFVHFCWTTLGCEKCMPNSGRTCSINTKGD